FVSSGWAVACEASRQRSSPAATAGPGPVRGRTWRTVGVMRNLGELKNYLQKTGAVSDRTGQVPDWWHCLLRFDLDLGDLRVGLPERPVPLELQGARLLNLEQVALVLRAAGQARAALDFRFAHLRQILRHVLELPDVAGRPRLQADLDD